MFPWEVLVTGAVGIAGIGGTIASARLSISAESKRIRDAEKRRIYAACLAAIPETLTATATWKTSDEAERTAAEKDLLMAYKTMITTVNEAELITRPGIIKILRDIITEFDGYIENAEVGDTSYTERIAVLQVSLFKGMRADLGESD
jgi:hypothetical protein